jgi:hypothetical protein
MESTRVVNRDNHAAGWVSAAGTRGSAVAQFRASGPVGDHIVKLYTGWQGQSYLNYEQSPVANLPRPQFTFHTTPGGAEPGAYAVALSPTQGAVGTRAMLRGEDFPADTSLQLVWETSVGSRVSGSGFVSQENAIGQVKVGSDGRIDCPVTIPEDLGGLHALALRRGDDLLARAFFVIETSIVNIAPVSGSAGTPVTIHLQGVG